MFKALMGGGRSSSDARSTTSSSSKTSRRKTDSQSASSRKSSRGDDRDRGLGDLSAYPPSTSGNRRGPPSIAGESVASTYVTAEPDIIDYPVRTVVERTPKRKDSGRDSKSSSRRERDRSESRERERRRSSRRSGDDTYDDDLDRERERDRRDRSRTYSGDHYVPAISTAMPSSAPGAQFAADIAAPGFSQFPMQQDNAMHPPATTAPGYSPAHDTSPGPFDPHVQHQFPGQFPSGTAQPYFPPNNPAGAAADYYGDQGQSVNDQPGVRPQQPVIIPNSQAHLMAASPSANPPPEPSSLGQVGAAAAYFTDDIPHTEAHAKPPTDSLSKPPKPGKPSKPSKPSSSSAIPAAAAAAAMTYGVGNYEESQAAAAYQHESYSSTTAQQTHSYSQPALTNTSKPPHSHGIGTGVGTGIGLAAAGAAAGYMVGHQHHESSPTHSSQYTFQNYEQSSHGSVPPYGAGPSNAMIAAGAAGAAGYAAQAAHASHNPGFYPHGGLAVQHRHRGPLTKFVDFWRDPEGVGRFEDYTETIGVCKYCFEPGTTSMNAPRKHHYHARRHSADRYSSGSSSRINKLSRYHSSEDERRSRKRASKKSSSWLPGMLAGYAAKTIFTGKDFDESYSVRSGHVSGDRASTYDREDDRRSYTSRGVVRRSGRSSPREYHSDSKHTQHTRRTRSRSRSSSRSGHHSFVKEAALGAAVGGAALAVAKSHRRSRSRSPSRVQRRKDSSSSTSFVDVSRPSAKSVGGFTSFFTSSSENRKKEKKKQRSKKSRGFFSFNSSSSSSLDADLAFGSGLVKKSSKLQKKQKKSKKNEDVDAALIGLGATATALAASSHFRNSRSTGQMLTRDTRHTNYTSSATNEDDEWVDAESEDQSSSSVSSALAFGASSAESGSDSNSSGGWKWGWGNKKKKKDKKSSKMDAAMAAGAGALGGAAIASMARRRDSRPPSEAGSLQQVYPVPTSDPSRFDVAKMSPSVVSGSQPPLVRPGPIPLQQPQPYTPVSQALYTTQGSLPGAIPAYSPGAVPPIFANEYDQYNTHFQGSRDASYARDDASFVERRKHHRSDSTPVFSTQESLVSAPKRRSTTRDQASVSFDLTEEQAERERRLDRRDRTSRDDIRNAPVQLIDHEEELAREEAERRERQERRKLREEEKRRSHSNNEKDSSSWVEAAAIGAIGAAAASSLVSSRKKNDEDVSEASSRHRDRRAERRAERRGDSSVISKSEVPEVIEEKISSVSKDTRDKPSSRKSPSRRPAPVYEDYAEFFAPEEVRHSHDQSSRDKDRSNDSGEPQIVEVVPASEREKNNDEPRDDLPQFAQEPYEGRDHLPWPVPQLNFIDPTPPQSVNGSVRSPSSPVPTVEPVREEEKPKEPEPEPQHEPEPKHQPESEQEWKRPSTGSRVSWGTHQTHEYEIPSSSEHDPHSPMEEISRDLSMSELERDQPKDATRKIDFGDDIEFAAIAAAGAQAAGFDPSVVINDPSYHTRTSPPGSEDEGTFSPRTKWAVPPQTDQPHGFVEGEIDSYVPSKSRDVEPPVEHVIDEKPFYAEPESFAQDKDISSSQRRDRGSIAQEVIEQLNGKSPRSGSPDDDVFSMPGGFDSGVIPRDLPRDDTRSVFSAPPERQSEKSKSKKSRRSGDDFELPREISSSQREVVSQSEEVEENAGEKSLHRKHRSKHSDNDSFSVDDDARSAITSVEDVEKSERRKHRHRSLRDKDFDDAASIASSPAATSYEDGEKDGEKSERRKHRHRSSRDKDFDDTASIASSRYEDEEKSERRRRRSKRDSDAFSVDDDARSAITSIDDGDKSERRKHRSRSSRDRDFDDNVSVTSSPARIDETREKRNSKDGKDEKEKDKSGSILRSIFGSRVSAPEGRTRSNQSSRSSSLEKCPSRDAVSEAGVDDERRRRKKRSSRHRSSSGGDKLDDDASDKEGSVRDGANLEEYRSQRQQKEERRRHRYEEIVESGKRRESEKDEKHSHYKDDGDKYSFLAERPEMPPAAERDEYGASGLESPVEGALATAAGIGLSEEILHQRPRSRSTSPPSAEHALDLAPKSQSRPTSPEMTRDLDQTPHRRRASTARSITESPTAVPIHFRRPPTSPGLSRAIPVAAPSPPAAGDSPTSPSQTRHRRPNSLEFRNSREIRPLWLVERHGASKGDLVEPDEVLPSLPSSKTSSRAPSVEDLRALNDEDAVQSWEPFELSPSMTDRRRPTGLTISTSRANDHDDGDLLGSQQATPTAEDFGASTGSRRSKPTYEFHSPSELLQDPAMYPEIPGSPIMEALPSAEGSVIGVKGVDVDTDDFETPTQEKEESLDVSTLAQGVGFAGVVDAAVIAAAKELDKPVAVENDESTPDPVDGELPVETSLEESAASAPKIGGFADIVNAAVMAEVVHDKNPVEEDLGEPGTAIEEYASKSLGIEPTAEPEAVKELVSESVEALTQPTEPLIESESAKELGPESIETPAQPVEPPATEEPVVEEVATTSSSKKKKKKKGKKGQTSVDLPSEHVAASEEQSPVEVTTEEQIPAAEVPETETRAIEPEAVPAFTEEVVAVEPQPEAEAEAEAEPLETSRELELEPLPAVATEAVEAEKDLQPESEPQPAVEVVSALAESDAAIISESQPESQPETPGETESEAAMTPAQKRKAKKAAKKKAKSLSVSESVEGSTNEVAPAQPSDEDLAPQAQKIPEAEAGEVAPTVLPEEQDVFQDANAPDVSAPVEQTTPDNQESRDIVEPAELTPVQETFQPAEDVIKPIDESASNLAQESEVRETQPSELAQVDVTTEAEPALETAQPEEIVEPAAATEDAAMLEKPVESDDDLFHEAVAEQPDVPLPVVPEQQEIRPEIPAEIAAESSVEPATETAAVEPEPEVPMTAAQKKKAKKDKKKRKSVAFEEPAAPSEPVIESQPEEVPKEIEAEKSTPVETADVQEPLTSGETQPPETEQLTVEQAESAVDEAKDLPEPAVKDIKDLPEPPTEESVPSVEAEIAPSGDMEPAAAIDAPEAAESTQGQPEQPAAQPEAEAEAEPEVPMTAAQKKKAKKDKKKKAKQQSVSSGLDEENLVIPEAAEPQPAKNSEVSPEVSESVEPIAEVTAPVETSEPLAVADPTEASEPAPDAPTDVSDAVKETTSSPEDQSVGVAAPEQKQNEPVDGDQPKEDVSGVATEPEVVPEASTKTPTAPELEAVTEAPLEVSDAAAPLEEPPIAEEKTEPEATPAEPEVPMTAAEKRKAKKAKKKKQQQESISSVSEETPAPETVSTPEAETAETSKDAQDVLEAEVPLVDDTPALVTEPEAIETSKEVDASELPMAEPDAAPQMEAPGEHDIVEATAEAPSVSDEAVPPVEIPQEDVLLEQPKGEESAQPPVAESFPIEAAEPQPKEGETPTTEAEVPMTAAQKKKAKKEKKKQQKRQSTLLDEQDTPATDDAPTELKEVEQTVDATPEVSVAEETKAPEEAVSAEVDKEVQAEATPAVEESPAPADVEKEASWDTSTDEPATTESTLEFAADIPPMSDVSAPESTILETTRHEPADHHQKSKDAVATPGEPTTETPLADQATPDQPIEAPTNPAETTVESATVEGAAAPTPENVPVEQTEEAEPTTPLPKKDKKKKKKKNKSLVLEEAAQPEPVQEESPKSAEAVEPTEPSDPTVPVETTQSAEATQSIDSTEPVETIGTIETSEPSEPAEPTSAQDDESAMPVDEAEPVINTEEPQSIEKSTPEDPISDEVIPEQSGTEAPEGPSQPAEPELPLTAAQKRKAKKDKKKRKSVAFEDEPPATPTETQSEQEQDAAVESTELEDVPSKEAAPSEELSESSKDAPETGFEVVGNPAVESEPAKDQVDTPTEGASTAVVEQADATDIWKENTSSEKPSDSQANESEAEPSTPPQAEQETVATIESEKSETPSDEKTDVIEEPSAQNTESEATETAAEAGLSAKERRKLKKKEKKKGKSVDLTEETSSPVEAPEEAEAPAVSQPEAPKEVEPEAPQVEQPEELTSAVVDPPRVEESEVIGAPTDSKKNETLEIAKSAEPETIDNPNQIAEQETPEPKELDEELPVVEPTIEAESSAQETEAQPEQPVEPDVEAGLSAKERRKLKKKEKKRQSKNLDVDENATTDAPTESDTRELSVPVTANSPAENDGKELQSHDMETPATLEKDLASTDEFLSSQVEQPQIESRSSDYPPPYVLERDFDSGEAKIGEQKDEDAVPVLEQPEVPSMEGEKSIDVGEVAEKEEKSAVDVEPVQEEVKSLEADVPVVVEEDIPEPKEEELAEKELITEPAAEEVEQPTLSKKQKKKDKKKKQKQEEKVEEEIVAPAPEPVVEEEKKDLVEAVVDPSQATEGQPIVEPEQTTEQSFPDAELPATEQTKESDLDVPLTQASEDVQSAKDIEPTGAENVTPEPEQLEEAPLSRKLSKKEKKKQRQALLAQQAETEASEPETQPIPETAEPETPAPVSDAPLDVPASTEQQEDVQPVETSDAFAPSSDSFQDEQKEVENPLVEAEQPIATEHERTEPVEESVFEEAKPEEADLAFTPADTTAIVPLTESTESSEEVNRPEPEAEQPAITRKMSKKEKKKAAAAVAAAAAAAALAAEDEKPAKPETAPIEAPHAPEETVVNPKEELALDDTPQTPEPVSELQQEAAEQSRDEINLVTSEVIKDIAEKPTAETEQQVEPTVEESKPEEVLEEPVVDEPLTRKTSKKEKRKAKKQAEQEVLETPPMHADTPAEITMEPESEALAVTESIPHEEPRDIVSESEPVAQEDSVAREVSELENVTLPVDEARAEEVKDVEAIEQFAPLGSLDAPSSTEVIENHSTTFEGQPVSESPDLSREVDIATAVQEEPEVVAPLSKKLSKMEKRKAKKKGAVEEEATGLEDEEPTAPEATADPAEPHAVIISAPQPQETEPLAETSVQPEPKKDLELESETTKHLEPAIEAQPTFEPEPVTDPTPIMPSSTIEEPEPESEAALSRKASKKKAKKAKKASQALELESPVDKRTEQEDAELTPELEALAKDIAGPTTRERKHDDEDWPAIDWEHGHSHRHDPPHDKIPEPESVIPVPESEAIGEFDESAIPSALQEAKKDLEQPIDEGEETWSAPLSKKDKKKAKKNKRKSEQAALVEAGEPDEEPSHKKIELVHESIPEPPVDSSISAPKEIETEPPARTTTPGGSKIANLFPGLERGGFRRSALDKKSPSLKDSAEEETAADLEANRDIAIPVSEAPLATTELNPNPNFSPELPTEGKREEVQAMTIEHDVLAARESPIDPDLLTTRELSIADQFPSPDHAASRERSSMLFGSSPSTRTEEATSPRRLLPSQMDAPQDASCGLRRTPSVIHGRHQQTPRTWNLEDSSIPAPSSSPPRSLFGPYDEPQSRPRTPLHPIAEQEPGDGDHASTAHGGTPRLEIKPEHVLPRPHTPVRKFTDNAMARETWPTPENDNNGKTRSLDDLSKASKFGGESGSPITQTPEQGMPVLKPSGSKGKLRRTNRSTSSDLRGASQALDSSQPPPNLDLDQLPSSSSYDPVTDKGKRPLRNMSDVYEGWGETPSSPRSPSRPPSVRRRRSMQHLQDMEARLDQLISENRLLISARDEAEDKLRNASVARRKSDRALNSSGADLRDREAEVEQLKSSVEWLQREMSRLTQENEGLTASNAALAAAHAEEVHTVRESSTRELDDLRSQHTALSTQMDTRVRQEIESALAQKDAELRRLREELEEARDKVKELQQQIATSLQDNTLVFRDEDYFDAACQKLCGHVQQWVLRFSKHSDHRRCRTLSELHDEKIADRFDNALLDGSDADSYLSDRVRRRDVFMSVVMTMVWEYIFTRYLFGMDREQRQKLKSLEKQLGEVGPRRAVHRWRATTLTLLSKRPAFASQRQSDTEAVALEIFGTLSRVLPPPSQVEAQLLESLRKVLRVAVNLSLEMRTQLAEFIMLPPLQPEYDTNGDLARQVYFNASLMNERSGETTSNDELESQQAVVRIVLFPLVVKKGNDVGEGDDEVVVCPAQVLVARPGKEKRVSKMMSGDRMSVDARSVYSAAPSMAPPSVMDMSNVI